MADPTMRVLGFECEPVRGSPTLVLVRTEDPLLLLHFEDDRRHRRASSKVGRHYVMTDGRCLRTKNPRAYFTYALVVSRHALASICLDLIRRGVKPMRCREML